MKKSTALTLISCAFSLYPICLSAAETKNLCESDLSFHVAKSAYGHAVLLAQEILDEMPRLDFVGLELESSAAYGNGEIILITSAVSKKSGLKVKLPNFGDLGPTVLSSDNDKAVWVNGLSVGVGSELKEQIASVIYPKAGIDYKTKQLTPFSRVTYYLAPKIVEMDEYDQDYAHALESSSLKILVTRNAKKENRPHHLRTRIELVNFSADETRIDFMQKVKNSLDLYETISSYNIERNADGKLLFTELNSKGAEAMDFEAFRLILIDHVRSTMEYNFGYEFDARKVPGEENAVEVPPQDQNSDKTSWFPGFGWFFGTAK